MRTQVFFPEPVNFPPFWFCICVHYYPRLLQASTWGLNQFQTRAFLRQGSHIELNSPPCWHICYFLFLFMIFLLDLKRVAGAKPLTRSIFQEYTYFGL